MRNKKNLICDGCGGPVGEKRRPVSGLCTPCLAKKKGVGLNCGCCGKPLSRKRISLKRADRGGTLYCGRECMGRANSGENHPHYRGGEIVDVGGYVRIRRGRKYYPKHRAVVESAIGRELKIWETVHHRDGDRKNNRIENLQLMGTRHPKGQFFDDWADAIQSRIAEANPACVTVRPLVGSHDITVVNVFTGATTVIPLV